MLFFSSAVVAGAITGFTSFAGAVGATFARELSGSKVL